MDNLQVIDGLIELQRGFAFLKKSAYPKSMRKALREGAKVVHQTTVPFLPRQTGTARKALKVRTIKAKRGKSSGLGIRVTAEPEAYVEKSVKAGRGRDGAYYANVIEYGSSPEKRRELLSEIIRRKRRRWSGVPRKTAAELVSVQRILKTDRSKTHGGRRVLGKRPMKYGFEASKDAALQRVKDILADELTKLARGLDSSGGQ